MPDLDARQVQAQLASLGLVPVDEEDLTEITHRLNALREALTMLELSDLDDQEPTTIFDRQAGAP
jgi:hypothetical protein